MFHDRYGGFYAEKRRLTNFVTTGKKTTRVWKYQAGALQNSETLFKDFVREYRAVCLRIVVSYLTAWKGLKEWEEQNKNKSETRTKFL